MNFSEVLQSLTPAGAGYRITVSDNWGQGRATFGGLMTAAGNEALRQLVPRDRALRSLQTTFVGPAAAGTWELQPRVLRAGRSVTVASCDIIESNQIAATIVAVYGGARDSVVTIAPQPRPALCDVATLTDMPQVEGAPVFVRNFVVRWSQANRLFTHADYQPTQAFIRHRDTAPLTESHVVGLIDCIPSPALAMFRAPAPASSLVWTLEFSTHRFDFAPDAWWRIDTDIDAAGEGYVNQTGVLTNPDGEPVAISRQLVAVFG